MRSQEPQSAETHLRARDLFLKRLGLIDRIVQAQCRRFRLQPEDAEDLASQVKLRLLENDYAVLKRFGGRCRWSTFLTTMVRNLCQDHIDRRVGRWRTSATAQKLGEDAVALETLWSRDGFTLREAVEQLRRRGLTSLSSQQLLALAAKLPVRCRRQDLGGEWVSGLVTTNGAEQRVEDRERSAALRQVGSTLAAALSTLPPEDRRILRMYYDQGLSFATIARRLGSRARSLYTCHQRCLRRLRRYCNGEGVSSSTVAQVEGWRDAQLEIDFVNCEVKIAGPAALP